MISFTEENYLKAIYKLLEKGEKEVSTNSIAEKMLTKAASVTDMLKKLSEKKLINYKKYQGVTLTSKGEKIAVSIIRKHRLWEVFLVEKLQFKWDEIHDIAEQLEHIKSDALIERIDKFLNFPKFDPHGDPIPDINGKFHEKNSQLLSTVSKNGICIITGVVDHSAVFLQYLDKNGLSLGSEIKVDDIMEYDRSFKIHLNKKHSLHLSNDVAKNILVNKKR
jgi:DtxR family Mn-dependent transcriptional regulator